MKSEADHKPSTCAPQFIIQSVLTVLITTLCTRWLLPTIHLFEDKRQSQWSPLRASSLSVLSCYGALATGLSLTRRGGNHYYLGMIAWWASIPLGLLGWGSANFIARVATQGGFLAIATALLAPTLYLWSADAFALRRGTWHISEDKSLGIFPLPDLPVEEMVFFFVTNLLLVVASLTFDRCLALARLGLGMRRSASVAEKPTSGLPPYSPSHLPLDSESFSALWATFITADPADVDADDTPSAYARDLSSSLSIISRASKSFYLASLLLPWDVRADLCVLYGFCRAADDCVDDESVTRSVGTAKQDRLALLSDLVAAIYREDLTTADTRRLIREKVASFAKSHGNLDDSARDTLRASASAVVSLRHLVPRSLWDELLRGYERDLEMDMAGLQANFRTMDELVEYAQCVAGCVGEMCVRVVLGRCGAVLPPWGDLDLKRSMQWRKDADGGLHPVHDEGLAKLRGHQDTSVIARGRFLVHHARRMGVALQLVNIARDVVADAVKLRRCYLPEDLLGATPQALSMQKALFAGRVSGGDVDSSQASNGTGSKTSSASTSRPLRNRRSSSAMLSALAPVEPVALRPAVVQLLGIATDLYTASFPAISHLSRESRPTQAGLRAACAVYFSLAKAMMRQKPAQWNQGARVRVSGWKRTTVALMAVYFGRG